MRNSVPLGRRARNLVVLAIGLLLVTTGLVFARPGLAESNLPCSSRYRIDKLMKNGARWQMCWEIRVDEGLSLSHVTYTPRGGRPQLVLGSARLAALYVPYDPGAPRYDDIGGLGWVEPVREKDCPGGKRLIDSERRPVVCTTSRSRGHAHRNVDRRTKILQGDQFEVFAISQIGWYSYLNQYTFYDDGTIRPQLGATGSLSPDHIRNPKYGWPVGVRSTRFSPNHAHIAYWRLDFNVAGARNDVVQQYDFSGNGTGRLAMKKANLGRETARTLSPMRWWRVVDTKAKNADGHPVSWEIVNDQSSMYRGPKRSESWSYFDLYVTQNRSCERLVIDNYFGTCPRGIRNFVNDEKLTDPVVWAGVSFHHVPRDEDEDPMPMHWQGLTITPRDRSAKSPLPQR